MLVLGAIAATWAAAVTKVPAEAAWAPVGATYTTTGTGEFDMLSTMSLVESRRPPGVFSTTMSSCAPSSAACSIALARKRAELAWMASSISIRAAWGSSASTRLAPWERRTPPNPNATRTMATKRLIATSDDSVPLSGYPGYRPPAGPPSSPTGAPRYDFRPDDDVIS